MKVMSLVTCLLALPATAFASDGADGGQACRVVLKVDEVRTAWQANAGPLGTAGEDLYFTVSEVERQGSALCDLARQSGLLRLPDVGRQLAGRVPQRGTRVGATLVYRVSRPEDVRPMEPGLMAVIDAIAGYPALVGDLEFIPRP